MPFLWDPAAWALRLLVLPLVISVLDSWPRLKHNTYNHHNHLNRQNHYNHHNHNNHHNHHNLYNHHH